MTKSVSRENSCTKKRPTNDRKLTHWAEASPNDDMDLCSDSDISLDSESPSPPASRPKSTIRHYQPTGTAVDHDKTTHRTHSRVQRSSSFLSHLSPIARRGYHPTTYTTEVQTPPSSPDDEYIIDEKHISSKLRKQAFKSVRDTPVDDNIVLTKWLRGSASFHRPEIATDPRMHDSVDCSDMTDSTLMGMPSFPPKDVLLDDFIEEWSLPDEETNDMIIFSLEGKHYIHDPLPPGWIMRVSKTRKRPFYIHPDHGVTWHCPVVLKPKSEALVLRRSSLTKMKQPTKRNDATSQVIAISPTPHPFSLEGSMSELIHHYNDPQIMDGYEGSVSSTSTTDSDLTWTAASSLSGGYGEGHALSRQQATNDWVTPLRLGIATPSKWSQPLGAPTSKLSIRKLSPIEETAIETHTPWSSQVHHQYATPNYVIKDCNSWDPFTTQNGSKPKDVNGMSSIDLVQPTPRRQRSTPRVSFEPMEVTSRKEPIGEANNGSEPSGTGRANIRTSYNAPNPKSPVQLSPVNQVGTPVSDTDDTANPRKTLRHQETIVMQSTLHTLAFRRRYTPLNTPLQVASTLRHTAMKGEGFQRISLSRTGTSGEIHPTLGSTPSEPKAESPFTLNNHENNKQVLEYDSCQSQLDISTPHCSVTSSRGDEEPVIHLSNIKANEMSQNRQNKPSGPRTSDSFSPVSQNVTTGSNQHKAMSSPNFYCTPSQSLGETNNDSPVMQSQRSNSVSRCDRHHSSPSASTVTIPLSIEIPESSPEKQFEGPLDDDYESDESISDTKVKTKPRPFNWRVLHPIHPICSLQRLDVLLEEQRERNRRNVTSKRHNRAESIKDSKKTLPRARQKQQAKARLMF